ncbi:hypothetical protein [uncultured Winogradskyella sp.]|uniref:hypothetical protein n=1 Tax=uncultured Winogradskyella sp. TaxID=395353 RepID=UPI0026053C4D|nr:hypothetical protein [uncultured Winogradskyella sp.]
MKKTILYIMVIALIWGCDQTPPSSITVSVLADKTDDFIPEPEMVHVRRFMENPIYESGKREFWYGSITNTSVNAQFKAELLGSDMFENNLKRKNDVDGFFESIASHLEHENGIQREYRNSSIIKPLVAHLHSLKESNSTDKVMLLYSDILEASDLLNVYNTKGYLELLEYPDKVIERFRNHVSINDLSGIELYIIYYPVDLKDNHLFEQMLLVYRKLFEGSGLSINVGIDNPLNPRL